MSRTTWALLVVLVGLLSFAIAFAGYEVPPCFGMVPDGHVGAECTAQWQATMPLFPQRFVYVLGVPLSVVVSFVALAGSALVVDLTRRPRSIDPRGTLADPD